MATTSFGEKFIVTRDNAASFVEEMSRPVPPTLEKEFKSHYTTLAQNKKLRERLSVALSK